MPNTLDVIAAAVAAWELNGNSYIKEDVYSYVTENGDSIYKMVKGANKNIVHKHCSPNHNYVELNYPSLKITSEHMDTAKKIRDYSKKGLFKMLGHQDGTDIPYEARLYQVLNQEESIPKHYVIICSSVYYYFKSIQDDFIKNKIEAIDSKHVGVKGTKMNLFDFEILNKIKSKNFPGWIYKGICDGNLYMFFSTKEFENAEPGSSINVTGKVKSHSMEKDKYPMTHLNYVNLCKGR